MANKSSGGSSSSSSSISHKALTGLGSLIRHLPTGTVFAFQFLSPAFSNSGHCDHPVNKFLTAILVFLCGFSCAFSSFTDSFTDASGKTHHGIATTTGFWPASSDLKGADLSKYKLRFSDFVHAFFAVVVFAVLTILDENTVHCFYPPLEADQKTLLMVLPPAVGVVAGVVFAVFPTTRHGIGYTASTTSDSTS